MSLLEEKLFAYAQNHLNVLLIGSPGIGKSTLTLAIAKKLGLKLKYFSASTLDPFADLVGIPVPQQSTKTVEFFRQKELEEAEYIVFDELNRAHPRVLNSVLEIIQFKTINGTPLKNLKMVWACINPPNGEHQVEELDPALVDRFHCYIKMSPEINLEYLKTKMNPDVASILKTWWDTTLDDNQKRIFTPRRVEYVGMMIDKGLPFRDAIPQGHQFPLEFLTTKLNKLKSGTQFQDELEPTRENILKDPDYFKEQAKLNPKLYTVMENIVSKFDKDDYFKVKDLLETFPQDLLESFLKRKFPAHRRSIREDFVKKGFDFNKYPKLVKAFGWETNDATK